jgi:hypothetical protein
MATYYKSRFLSDPIVYIQDRDIWGSYAPGGVIRQADGTIPDSILGLLEEIDEVQARELIGVRAEEAESSERERIDAARRHAVHVVGRDSPFPWMVF